jgi:outer membrane protein assembly factor BamD
MIASGFIGLAGCNSYQKVLKSGDVNYKYEKAKEFYDKGQYFNALPIFEELLGLYKGSSTTEDLYYYYAMCYYMQRNYLLAAYYFQNYVDIYPNTKHSEECLYNRAECYWKLSASPSLDQENTKKAIEAYQVYINTYPESEKMEDCNEKIDKLRGKLEKKAVEQAKLYYRTRSYRAAAVSLDNLLINFPDIERAEYIKFLTIQANFKFAENSYVNKKAERYADVIDSYESFVARYSESEYMEEAEEYLEEAHFHIIKSHFEHAQAVKPMNKQVHYQEAIVAYGNHIDALKDEKLISQAQKLKEDSYFGIVKNNYQLAQAANRDNKAKFYSKAIEAYYTFVDNYAESKHYKELERIFKNSTENLNQLQNL